MPEEISERIRAVMIKSGLSMAAFARALGSSPQRMRDVLRGKQRPPADMLAALAEVKDVDIAYIITGDRTSASTPDELKAALRVASHAQNAQRTELLDNYDQCSTEDQAAIRRMAALGAQSKRKIAVGRTVTTTQHVSADRGGVAAGRDANVGTKPRSRRK